METTTLLAFLLTAAAAQAPAPAAPRMAVTERAQWSLVQQVNSVAAYHTYLRRFPLGRHAERARRALRRLGQDGTVPALPPANPPPPPPSQPDPCSALLAENPAPAQAVAYQAARRDNRLADLRLYVAAYPGGACTPNVERMIAARAARRAAIAPIPGLGPLPPHRLTLQIFTNDDYPATALRAEATGVSVAAWEVAEDGVPEACSIVVSSGSSALDRTTCTLIVRRMAYDPARDAAGNPVRGTDSMRVRWVLPPEEPPEPPRVPRK
jgi:protein TonB